MKKPFSCPHISGLFEKRLEGDDALLELARIRFHEAGIGAEFYAESVGELASLLRLAPFPEAASSVHLPRGLDLLDKGSREFIKDFARTFSGSIFGFVVHDQHEAATRPEDYRAALEEINTELLQKEKEAFLFVEYAVGLDIDYYVELFRQIRGLKLISACIDVGHIGLRQARLSFSEKHRDRDFFALKPEDNDLPALIKDVASALHAGRERVLQTVRQLAAIGKHLHFHLHDGNPLAAPSRSGMSDHMSFFDRVPLPFEYNGEAEIAPMFGPPGLFGIVREVLDLLAPELISFTLEIHPDRRRLSLNREARIFAHWRDLENAEKMNYWLSELGRNAALLKSSCQGRHKTPAEKMIIYNLFPLLAGKFSEWESHLSRAAGMGFNWVFVNPVQNTGSSRSIYSIADYFSFNPALVDQTSGKTPHEQVRGMIQKAEKLGLSLMTDLVINHCSVDAEILKSHPEWFLWESEGNVAHPFAYEDKKKVVWKDLAQFDHKNTPDKEGMLRFFMSIIEFLANLGFRGFRCDAAYQIPRELWERLISETKKKYPDALFFAETLGCTPELTEETAGAGFDYIFNSAKWWDFESGWLMDQYRLTREIAPSISFPESHDTVRLAEELDGSVEGLKQRYLFAALFSAGVMMPIGFEYGFRKRLNVVTTRPEDWEETGIDITAFIKEVNEIKSGHEIFREDAVTAMLNHHPGLLSMWKGSSNSREEALLILNKETGRGRKFSTANLRQLLQSGGPISDISPGRRIERVASPYACDLAPGQGIVLASPGNCDQENETPD